MLTHWHVFALIQKNISFKFSCSEPINSTYLGCWNFSRQQQSFNAHDYTTQVRFYNVRALASFRTRGKFRRNQCIPKLYDTLLKSTLSLAPRFVVILWFSLPWSRGQWSEDQTSLRWSHQVKYFFVSPSSCGVLTELCCFEAKRMLIYDNEIILLSGCSSLVLFSNQFNSEGALFSNLTWIISLRLRK